jgi:hypothetical protein
VPHRGKRTSRIAESSCVNCERCMGGHPLVVGKDIGGKRLSGSRTIPMTIAVSVARMSEAKSGLLPDNTACRYAHAGYELAGARHSGSCCRIRKTQKFESKERSVGGCVRR